ncbi:MAG: hypothetical protein E7255_02170 [Lachnospiraceae bacterium]|jgi:hypothetical protein|nr:hypothetical protein [Lachnospiraceae bacterium]
MSKIRKVISFFVVFTLAFGVISQTAYASDQSAKIDSIIRNGKLSVHKAELIGADGTEYEVNVYEKKQQVSANEYVKEYAYKLDENNMTLATSGSQSQQIWDSSGGVEGFLTLYYEKDGDNYLITRITGDWLIHDSGTAIKDKKLIAACNHGFYGDQYISQDITTGSFDITTGWERYAESTAGFVAIGARTTCKLYRISSGSSWKFEVDNVIAGGMIDP